jgi:microcystin-dependent protein
MGATTNHDLPYPEAADPADVPTDVRELAERLDALLPPVGTPLPWLAAAIPSGYIEFAGQTIAQATYPKLYALFGGTMPDLRGRYLMGVDGSHPIGSAGGEAAHVLSVAEMPSHSHTSHYWTNLSPSQLGGITAAVPGGSAEGPGQTVNVTGGNGAHNNLPPYRTVRWLTLAG